MFVASSILCALAPTGAWLIAARFVQGIGGSMILPTTLPMTLRSPRLSGLRRPVRAAGAERGIAFAVWAPSRWRSTTPLVFAAAAPVLLCFVLWERSRGNAGRSVLFDLSLFRIPTFSNGNVTALTVSLGEFGLILSLPLWFQYALGMDALQAGLALLPLAVGSFVASGSVHSLSRRLTALQMVRLGIVLEIASLAVLALLVRPDSTAWTTAGPLFVYGMGVGFATAQLTQLILVDVPVDRSGQGSSTQSTARQVGSALGIAILGTALFTTLRSGTESRLSEEIAADPSVAGLVDGVSGSAGALISELAENPATAAIAEAAREALTQGVSVAAWLGVVALVVGLLTTIPLGRRDASTTDTPTEPEAEPLEQG